MIGIGVALSIGLLMMFFYVLIWGAIIGGIFWLIYVIKNYFFSHKSAPAKSGRIIEHNDHDKN